jgi:hypothetical protein
MFQLGTEELAEQERHVAELRSRPPALLAVGAVVASLLAKAVFSGPHPRGWEVPCAILAGHVSLSTTQIYVAVSDERLEDAIQRGAEGRRGGLRGLARTAAA